MRRLIPLAILILVFAACAAPEFRLAARFSPDEIRVYRVVADADVTISAAELNSTERTHLEATTRITVEEATDSGATLTMTITPTRLTRNDEPVETPSEQQVRLEVRSDGRIERVSPLEGTGELEAAQVEDLVPLIGPPLPSGRVHLADRWSRPISVPPATPTGTGTPPTTPTPVATPGGNQNARFAALRVVDGYDCAIVALSTRRPVVREREVGGIMLRLEGVEFAAGEMAFAFREGFPVSVRSDAEARLAVSGGPAEGGGVVIRSTSVLTLLRRTGGS